MAPSSSSSIISDEIDESTTDEEGDYGANETGDREQAEAVDGPEVGRGREDARGGKLDRDVPIGVSYCDSI